MGKSCLPLLWAACAGVGQLANAQVMNGVPRAPILEQAAPAQGATGQASHAGLTLAQALARAQAHPELQAAQLEWQASGHDVQQAGRWANPELSLALENANRRDSTGTVVLSQPLPLGGKRAARVQLAERGQDLAQAELAIKQAELRASVSTAFVEVLVAQERVQLAQAALVVASHGLDAARKRVEAGKVSPVEATKAQVAEAQARLGMMQAQGEHGRSLQFLRAAMGLNSLDESVQEVDGSALDVALPPNLDSLLAQWAASPAQRRSQAEVAQWSAQAEVARSQRTPDVSVQLGIKRERDAGRNQLVVGLSMPLPLFDRNQDAELAALKRRDKAQALAQATALSQRQAVLAAHQRWLLAAQSAQLLQDTVLPGAQTAFVAARKGFALGKFSHLEALDAQRTWLEARVQHLGALADAYRAAGELERLLGQPLIATHWLVETDAKAASQPAPPRQAVPHHAAAAETARERAETPINELPAKP